jgi:hypothetical protein
MTALMAKPKGLKELEDELIDLANAQHESRAYRRLFSAKLSRKGLAAHNLQKVIWMLNRRDCWAFAQAKAPFLVKQLIWEHESDELHGGGEREVQNHYELAIREGESVGLKREDFQAAEATDTTLTCCKAWLHLVSAEPWLKGFSACAALELTNSGELLKGGKGASRRMAENIAAQLGIGMEKQHSLREHIVADVEHANIMMKVARLFARDELDYAQILDGARESWAIDRVFREHLADLIESLHD